MSWLYICLGHFSHIHWVLVFFSPQKMRLLPWFQNVGKEVSNIQDSVTSTNTKYWRAVQAQSWGFTEDVEPTQLPSVNMLIQHLFCALHCSMHWGYIQYWIKRTSNPFGFSSQKLSFFHCYTLRGIFSNSTWRNPTTCLLKPH